MDTRTADIIANEWPTENVGGPHWRGYGNLNLMTDYKQNEIMENVTTIHKDTKLSNTMELLK
jgi:outer membrane usher protein FimD/PapC